jgi:hypothetical protein
MFNNEKHEETRVAGRIVLRREAFSGLKPAFFGVFAAPIEARALIQTPDGRLLQAIREPARRRNSLVIQHGAANGKQERRTLIQAYRQARGSL